MKRTWTSCLREKFGRLFLGSMLLLLAACGPARSAKNCPTPEAGAGAEQIPALILQASDRIVLSRVGKGFFGQFACFRPELSNYEEGDLTCIEPGHS